MSSPMVANVQVKKFERSGNGEVPVKGVRCPKAKHVKVKKCIGNGKRLGLRPLPLASICLLRQHSSPAGVGKEASCSQGAEGHFSEAK